MRNVSRRSFTVEVKSTGRRASTIIPTRVAAAPAPIPQTLFSSPAAAPREPAAEKRRVLPNLIVPEVPEIEAAPLPVAEDAPPRRPRGRPRKHPLPTLPVSAPPVVREVVVAPEPVVVMTLTPVEVSPSAPTPRKRKELPGAELPRGERWKTRRLGRWSR